ncbi:MAG TPA: hypothetical protein VHF06_11180 [Pseudonocardiaceae bacterium]|nr:hypothetical protein [Pseudonocardiaceae bacterium]
MNELMEEPSPDAWAPQLRIGGFSVLLPLVLGLALLLFWILLGGFGIVLGLIADVIALVKWRQRYGAVFPKDVAPRDLFIVFVATVVLGALAFLADNA